MSEGEPGVSRRGICRPQSGRILKYIVRLLEEFQARCDHFQELKPCFAFLVNPCNVNVSLMAVQLANRLLQTCLLKKKTDGNARKSGPKKSTVNATLHLIFSDRFQKLNMQNLKYQYDSFLYIAQHIDVNFFLCN